MGLALVLAVCWPPPALGLELPDQAATGAQLFENHCAGCHINGGNIIRRRQTLRMAALERNGLADPQAIAAVAAAGRGQMSGYGEVLGRDGVEAVAAWVWEQAQQGWPSS
ncbi:MAG: c-type cytochrome [Cyanobacteriota bacterium]|nr:c-type cytochrome [Cyanobacteriota bacterium]